MKKCFWIVIIKPGVAPWGFCMVMRAIRSKLELPLVQVTTWGQVFKFTLILIFLPISLHFTTLNIQNNNITVTHNLCVISQGLPKWTKWNSGGRFPLHNFPRVNNQVYIVAAEIVWDESLVSLLLLCCFWSLNWCEL